MLHTSYQTASVFRGLAARLRQTIGASTTLETLPAPVPSGKTKMSASADLSAAHLVDPTRTFTIISEISTDGGANWTQYAAATAQGVAGKVNQPAVGTDAPAPGTLVRSRIVAGAQPVDSGLLVTSS